MKNEGKTVSSSYPPRSSSDEKVYTIYFTWQVVYEIACYIYNMLFLEKFAYRIVASVTMYFTHEENICSENLIFS